jgi:IS605 OrfB family transposase
MPTKRKAYKYRLKTNKDIEAMLNRYCGSGRFLWNKSLAMNLERLESKQSILWYNELAFWLTLWKRSDEYSFLKECPSQVLQQKLRDLEKAFRDSFDRKQPLKRIPVFKKKKISRLHHTIANVRSDFLHKLSTGISKNQAKVYVERLNIRNMSSSARGTIEEPGRNVKAKSGLNKSILDQGWFELRRQLQYKLSWRGGQLVEVDYRHTSQRCSCCGHTAKENRPSQAVFSCLACGHEANADVNAAKNIITVGQTGMACPANRRSGRQQEPAGTREGVLSISS